MGGVSRKYSTSAPETDYLTLIQLQHADFDMWKIQRQQLLSLQLSDNAKCITVAKTYIAYCFHSVDGYSKVGSYTGNGNADGTFIYTGFRPAFVMLKKTGNAANGLVGL